MANSAPNAVWRQEKAQAVARAFPSSSNNLAATALRPPQSSLAGSRSGDLAEHLADAALHRLRALGGNLLGERGERLALLGKHLELLAGMGGGQLDHFRK